MDVEVTLAGEPAWLLPERAVYLPKRKTLVIADPHWGKDATFHAAAIPVPSAVQQADLDRLSQALERTEATRLIILGDLLHARAAQGQATVAMVDAWRRRHAPLEILAVQGNHDRHAGAPSSVWDMQDVGTRLVESPLVYCHHPEPHPEGYVLAGHLHPRARLFGAGGQTLALPCFWLRERVAVLPAFSRFTAGADIRPGARDQVFAIAEDEVLAVHGGRMTAEG